MEKEFHHWPANLLAEHIANVRYPNIHKKLEHIKAGFMVLTTLYSKDFPQLSEAESLFLQSAAKIETHLFKEAATILPFVRRYSKELKKDHATRKPGLQSACPYIHEMYHYHKTESLDFDLIINSLDQLFLPRENHYIFEEIYENLLQLKILWFEQIRLENDILFPKIVEMEAILYPI